MPSKGRIQAKDFNSLMLELGVNQNGIPFELRSEVTPVVLVGGTVSFVAAPTPAYRVPDFFTAGQQIAPAIGTVLADTGPLPVGDYSVQILMNNQEFNFIDLEWRDAANAANLVSIRIATLTGEVIQYLSRFNVENINERFRLINVNVGGAGITYNAMIQARI